MNFEPELDDDERDALRAWACADVPAEFAERIAAQATAHAECRRTQAADPQPMWAAWWIGIVAAAAAVVLALSLLASPAAHEPDRGSDDLAALRLAARELLARECTPCHLAESRDAEPAAVAVFDVTDPQWDAGLSSAQLALAVERMADSSAATEVAGFRRYVDAELARRGGGVSR